jgi:hypothetical protein
MKNASLFGFITALAGAFLVLVMYFLGFYSDPAKISLSSWISSPIGLAIVVTCMVLGVKARRAEIPASDGFGFGRAWWSGMSISIVSAILTSIFNYCFYAFIDPGLNDLLMQVGESKLEAKGMSSDQIEKLQALNKVFMTPPIEALSTLILGVIVGCIIALIVAAFLKQPDPAAPPVL